MATNLYPPIVEDFLPAFPATPGSGGVSIPFELSNFNTLEDIKYVQVAITYQKSNVNALDEERYSTGIMVLYEEGFYNEQSNSLRLNLAYDDLKNSWQRDIFYKIQFRFCDKDTPPKDPTDNSDPNLKQLLFETTRGKYAPNQKWLDDNKEHFSEWSKVTLIKCIGYPKLDMYFPSKQNKIPSSSWTEYSDTVVLTGRLNFYEKDPNSDVTTTPLVDETEQLDYYQITISDATTNQELYKSEIIYPYPNNNSIYYKIPLLLKKGQVYIIEYNYTTTNGYHGKEYSKILAMPITKGMLKARVEMIGDPEYGCITVKVTSPNAFSGILAIKRSSSETNYVEWEDIHIEEVSSLEPLDLEWNDYTIESGVYYKYGVQKVFGMGTEHEHRTALTQDYASFPGEMVVFDSAFLTNDKFQFTLKYNLNISSFQRKVADSITETIGSKYPFARRNGYINYRTFPIEGLITAFCDEEGRFFNKKETYGDNIDNYAFYNAENNITPYNDFIYEKRFRDKIMDFLYDNSLKLFRSPTEGNILVKLTDITLTPNEVLSRMLYSFSATATEIDECNAKNYEKYHIQSVDTTGEHKSLDSLKEEEHYYNIIGQIYKKNHVLSDTTNFNTLIKNQIDTKVPPEYRAKVNYFSTVNITVQGFMPPQGFPITISGRTEYQPDGEMKLTNLAPNTAIQITQLGNSSLSEYNDTEVFIEYIANVTLTDASEADYIAQINSMDMQWDQLHTTFAYNANLSDFIYDKYTLKDLTQNGVYQELNSIDEINISAPEGTVFYIRDSWDLLRGTSEYRRHVIGPTGVLHLKDADSIIIDFYYGGIHVTEATAPNNYEPRDTEFVEDDSNYKGMADSAKKKNHVYKKDGSRVIWYNHHEYPIDNNNDIHCPVDCIIDYKYELLKGTYSKVIEDE